VAVHVEVGDITTWQVDAVVNAANAHLAPGGGVCGAIHRAGGPTIAAECRKLIATDYPHGVPVGGAVATTAGQMPARFVIHAVGPIYGSDPEPEQLLADAYRNSLALARELGLASIAFPAISTGIYGFPAERAAPIVWQTVSEADGLDVHLVFFSDADRRVFEANRQ
jgi:O-acetyl-ADP-ribose deacetylase (regulator of RNase III)